MFTTAELFGRFHSPRKPLGSLRDQLAAAPPQELEPLLGSALPAGLLAQTETGQGSRERVYTVRITFWTFLWQALNPGSSCRCAVRKVMAWFALLGRGPLSPDDSPYCQARRRLERHTLERALAAAAQTAEQRARSQWRFHDREVLVGDGTTSSAADTPANQRAYPQSAKSAPGCGFPLIKWVALFSLTSGALLEFALGNKHKSELALFRKIWTRLKAGTIFLADRGFCDYVTLAELVRRQVDAVLRLNASRADDLRRGKRLGPYERLVTWQKPPLRARTATQKLWRRLPGQITLRLIRYPVTIPGFRPHAITLVTTLLDPVAYPAAELAQLYLRRWRVELFLRDLKTTMRLDHLTCKTPPMLDRELLMQLVAYNLLRALLTEAANLHEVELDRLSFKGAMDTLRHFSLVIAQARNRRQRSQLIDDLLAALAQGAVPLRPHRVEPRCQKRRYRSYPVLTQPRGVLKASRLRLKKPRK